MSERPMPGSGSAAANVDARPLLPLNMLVTLSVYWLGILTIQFGLGTQIVPSMVEDMVGTRNAGTGLAVINGVAVIASIFVQPTVGVLSDYTISRWGRRKPYIFIGGLLDMVFLYGIATSNTFVVLIAFYFLIQVSSNFAQGPFQGYVPDLVPARQVGTASGLMGLMIVLGSIVGAGIAMFGLQEGGSLFAATLALGVVEIVAMLIVVLRVHEGTVGPRRTMSWPRVAMSAWGSDILREKSVLWLLLVRLLFLGAAAAATSLGLYYFQRTHGLSEAEASRFVFYATIVVAGMSGLASIPGARLSDRFGRKPIIYGGMALTAIGLLGLALAPSPELAIALFVPAGIGIGAFLSVDWALMSDVIPKHTSARYMGILNAGTAMATPVFLVVGGLTMDAVGRSVGAAAGPVAAMYVAIGFLVLAAFALRQVDARRRELGEPAAAEPELAAA
ncbi:MAG TPA: MFS transporter [Candidatus Limnocylindria bacterium]|nr:MFS transporter [Candidatus Limnocylindria bacterium]